MHAPVVDGAQRAAVEQELGRILQSAHFRTSRRSQQFLRYVVEHSLDGHDDRLKERSIGVAIFDRAPDYDTGEDATVRVAANEVRKRLAQYHMETPPPEVMIHVPAGSYHAEFRWVRSLQIAVEAKPPARAWAGRPRWTLPATLLFLAILATTLVLRPSGPERVFEQFWGPLLDSRQPVLICLANPLVYLLADPLPPLDRPAAGAGPEDPDPRQLGRRGLIESLDQYVGVGDAYAASHFTALFSRLGRPVQIRIGREVAFADLRTSPAVLIGAYSNRWSMEMNPEYRFGFDRYSIVDRQQPGRVWRLENLRPGYRSDEDYLLISRILHGYSGEPLVLAAGITHAGTQAAGELLTRPEYLESALREAPPGWQGRNLQLVLHCRVVDNTPRPPRLVASHSW